jgi:hypothetical protein
LNTGRILKNVEEEQWRKRSGGKKKGGNGEMMGGTDLFEILAFFGNVNLAHLIQRKYVDEWRDIRVENTCRG